MNSQYYDFKIQRARACGRERGGESLKNNETHSHMAANHMGHYMYFIRSRFNLQHESTHAYSECDTYSDTYMYEHERVTPK